MVDENLVITSVNTDDAVATLSLNRPEKKNALSRALLQNLAEAIEDVRARRDINCLILEAAGDSFCAGQDLYDLRKDWRTDGSTKTIWGDHRGSTMQIVKLLRDAPQITIASVQGYCLGGGMVLMNGCDLAFAADDAMIGMPEIIRGSYGRSATPTLFHSRVPIKTAFYIQLTGHNLTGIEAARVGVVSKSVAPDALRDHVYEIARQIATRNPVALEHAKIAAYTEMDLSFDLAVKADDAIGHRMRFYTDPLSDVDGYLDSQKGGPNLDYRRPEKNGKAE